MESRNCNLILGLKGLIIVFRFSVLNVVYVSGFYASLDLYVLFHQIFRLFCSALFKANLYDLSYLYEEGI